LFYDKEITEDAFIVMCMRLLWFCMDFIVIECKSVSRTYNG